MSESLRLPVSVSLPPCIERAMRDGPAPDDGWNWISVLAHWWAEKGADKKTLPLFLKIWYNDSDTTEELNDQDFDNLVSVGVNSDDTINCAYLSHIASFRSGCTKANCVHYTPPDQASKINIPAMDCQDFIGKMSQQPVNVSGLSEALVRSLNIKRLPGGTLAVYNNGVYVTEDSEYIIDAIVRNYLRNEMNTKLRSNLLMHIRALADPVIWDDFERFPHLLCCPNGVVDLQSGILMDHDPVYMMLHKTRVPYNPSATCDLWKKTLDEIVLDAIIPGISAKDRTESQTDYYQRVWGCSTTGETRDEIVPIHQGAGASGKTTITSAIQNALGSYVQQVDPDILMTKGDIYKPSYELATGVGKRIFLTNESKEGAKINTQLIKIIATEGAEFNARQIREKPFTYTLRAKAHLVMNPPPILDEQDKSVQRRLHLIKYEADFSEKPDKTLKNKLKTEASGVLNWLVEGAIRYYKDGLMPTKAVSSAVKELFDSSDPLFGFIDANLDYGEIGDKISSDILFKSFKTHCSAQYINTDKFDPRPFGRALNAELKMMGWKVRTYRSNGKTVYQGLKFKPVVEHE